MATKAVNEALAHLREISSQIDVAVIFDAQGKVVGSSGAFDDRAGRVARASLELLQEGERLRDGDQQVAQLDASTLGGSLFVVRDGEWLIAATTPTEPTVGLVFYDLKSCLRAAAAKKQEAPAGKSPAQPKPKAASKRSPARKSPSSGSRGGSRASRKRDAEP
jgi:predicted regulator of Ras-like GTPase activity (Roadblock/LC7/MglB family)